MKTKKIIAVLLAAILTCGVMTSCNNERDDGVLETYTPETVEPIDEGERLDYTNDENKLAYINGLRASFTDMEPTDAASFTVTATDAGVTVTGYVGTASEVRIPSVLEGKAVVGIANGAFAGSGVITKLYIPDGVTSIGSGILKDATALRALRTPMLGASSASAQYLGYLFGAEKHEDNAVSVPTTLEYLELGGNMESLADFALFECDDLLCVTLPDSMKTLGAYSLYYCQKLIAINVDKLTTVSDHALDSCAALTRLEFGKALTLIGRGALEGCIGLRRLQLPFVGGTATENTYLGYLFGAAVPDFSEGYYPPYLTEVNLLEGCTAIGDYAFYECGSLASVSIPEGVTSIGVRAFSGCVRMTLAQLPNSLTTVQENAFYGCLSLERVLVGISQEDQLIAGGNLTVIGVNAFYNCGSLRYVNLSNTLTALPASCFAGCVSLEQIDLGGVTQVGKNAFYRCTRLQKITAQPGVTFAEGNEPAEALLYGEA